MKLAYRKQCGPYVAECLLINRHSHLFVVYRLYVPPWHRRQGIATGLMRRVMAAADKENARLALLPSAFGSMDTAELEKWYSRLGFVYDRDSYYMFREPQREAK